MRDYYSFKTKEILGKRSVKKGDVILTSDPFVYIIDSQFRGQYCDHCVVSSRLKSLKSCRQCEFVYYCSKACEEAGRDVHQHECKQIKKLDPYVPPNFARLLARLIFRLKNGGETFIEYYGEKKPRKFKDLMNHYRDIKDDGNRMSDVESLYEVLRGMIGEENLPDETDFIGLYGRVLVNRFCLMDYQICPIGSVVYLAGSIFDHSCIPNAYATFIGTKLEVRTLVDMPHLDYNKVFISYIDMMKTTAQRREELQTNWFFWCECSLCLNNDRRIFESCLKCNTPNCGAPIPVPEKCEKPSNFSSEPPLTCLVCHCTVAEDFLEEYQSAVAFTKESLKGLKEDSPALDVCLNMLERQGNLFSPVNVWRVRALDFAFNSAYVNAIYRLAIDYGRQNAEGMRFFYGSEHPTFGLFLMKLGKSLLYLKEYREGLTVAEEAERVLTISLGENHDLVAEEILRLKMIANEDVNIFMERRIIDKEKAEHEKVCKHCGRRKNLANKANKDESSLEIPINGLSKKVNNNDVYASIDALKRMTESLIKNEVVKHTNSKTNGDIFASMSNGPNGNIFSKVYSLLSKQKKNGFLLEPKREADDYITKKDKKEEIKFISEPNNYNNSRRKVVDKFPTVYERNESSNHSIPETNGNSHLIKPSSKNHSISLLRSDDKEANEKDKKSTNSIYTGNDIGNLNKGMSKYSQMPEMGQNDRKGAMAKVDKLERMDLSNNLSPKDAEKVIMPSSLTRLLRYGDIRGITTKSKVNRDNIYGHLVNSNAKVASTEDVGKIKEVPKPECVHKQELPTEPENISPPNKPIVKEQENTTEVKSEVLPTDKKIKKEKSDEWFVKYPEQPREKIGRLYTPEIEQSWGLDYVPEKPKANLTKYKLAETNKIWDKFISDADIRWARYIAEIEFNKLIAQEANESDDDDDDCDALE